eukprot:TRINITY_DN779_c0_g2_i2.p1 TRINITY_DN779_c0_g2~~TRINITY_DN779_c0_g2_i2.p1  ORF type:complete len:100 (-),score=12.43 TRINITY_DN779_c0_g2_i2:303-602(-)
MLSAMNEVVGSEENKEALKALKAEQDGMTTQEKSRFKFGRAHDQISAMFRGCMRHYGYLGSGYVGIMENAEWYLQMPGFVNTQVKAEYYKLTASLSGLV